MKALLDSLHDPVTRVDLAASSSSTTSAPRAAVPAHVVDGVTVVPVSVTDWRGLEAEGERLVKELAQAKLAVIDLRATDRNVGELSAMAIERVASHLTIHEGVGSVQRKIEHRGYRPQTLATSGGYSTLLASVLADSYPAGTTPRPSRVVFLTNELGSVPDVAWAMHRSGDAIIAAQGALSGNTLVETDDVELPGGYVAHLRLAEAADSLPREPDLVLGAAMADVNVEQAVVSAAKHPPRTKRVVQKGSPDRPPAWHPDATYASEPYPTREHRVLALFRFWSVIHYFYPYLPLMGDAWDQSLAEALPRFESASNAREYALAVAELAARIPDGHVGVWGSDELDRVRGTANAPFEVRVVEGRVVVTGITDAAAVGDAKMSIGDVVTAVDGEPIATRMARVSKLLAASNEVTRTLWSARAALRGDPQAKLAFTVTPDRGESHSVVVGRSKEWPTAKRPGPVFRLLDGGIGYADLDRLEVKDVDAMFAAFEKSPAIVFDMRGYPHGTAWAIAPRLNVRKTKIAAQFFEPFVSPGSGTLSYFEQPIPSTDKPLYRGKTVMLIDERTMSQAEHTGLFFEAANGTTFIGSQTAGANGDITDLSLPGGLHVRFSGHDVRHADGRQLQRTGLVPEIEVRPTIDGLRAGRDEVLERAVTFLETGK